MTEKEITATSGLMTGLNENTRSEKNKAAEWSRRSVSITVSETSRSNRLTDINDRLRGRSGKLVSTSK